MQETDLRAFVANRLKQDFTCFFSPGKFLQKKSATWKVFVFSAPGRMSLLSLFRKNRRPPPTGSTCVGVKPNSFYICETLFFSDNFLNSRNFEIGNYENTKESQMSKLRLI